MIIIYQEIGLKQAFLSKLPENGIKLLNWLIDQMRSKPSIKVSIKFICDQTKLTEITVHRWLAKFKLWGVIQKEQLYGDYCHNTFTLNRSIFKYARYLKYHLSSLWDYLDFVYIKPRKKVSDTPYIEEKDINKFSFFVHPNLFINSCNRSYSGDGLWGISYQESIFHMADQFERTIRDDHQLENFKKILEEAEMSEKEQLFWDGLTKSLKLSQHGLIKLQVFPASIVNSCYKKLQVQSKVPDRVKWLIRECDNQCKTEGRYPVWSKYYEGLRLHGIDQKSSLIDEDNNYLDFSKPVVKEVEIYSTRDLSSHKKDLDPDTLQKGLLFLGDFLSNEIQDVVKDCIKDLSNKTNV